jgi:predicted dehydrogenase
MARHARLDPDFITGTAIHLVDTVRCLGGDARAAGVRSRQVAGAVWTAVSLEFESGALASLEILPTAGVVLEQYELFGPGYRLLIRVGGTDRGEALAWEDGVPVLDVRPAQDQPEYVQNGTLAETTAFLDALLENRPVQPSPRQVLGSVELCHSIQNRIHQEKSV